MKVGKVIEVQQPDTHKKLNTKRKQNKEKRGRSKQEENLSFSDVAELMQHDSYCRGRGGSIKQRSWSK